MEASEAWPFAKLAPWRLLARRTSLLLEANQSQDVWAGWVVDERDSARMVVKKARMSARTCTCQTDRADDARCCC